MIIRLDLKQGSGRCIAVPDSTRKGKDRWLSSTGDKEGMDPVGDINSRVLFWFKHVSRHGVHERQLRAVS